jgi:hypothetical protein
MSKYEAKYEEVMTKMRMQWPDLKGKLTDEKTFTLMEDYYNAYMEYDAVMNDRNGELQRLNGAYRVLFNHVYGMIE